MKWLAPDYYPRFTCIADRCRHSCCAQGWEIDIDARTHAFYRSVPGEFGARLAAGIQAGEVPTFQTDRLGRCPFWNSRGLCDIILTLGEDALCDICADHPRFRNFFSDRVELGVGLCCEEACRIILENQDTVRLIELDCEGEDPMDEADARLFENRDAAFAILQDRTVCFDARLEKLAERFDIPENQRTPAAWAELYRKLERLDEQWTPYLDALASAACMAVDDRDTVWEQLAVYFVFRHTAEAMDDREFAQRLAFCVHAVQIIRTICVASGAQVTEVCRLYSGEIEYSDENVYRLMQSLR